MTHLSAEELKQRNFAILKDKLGGVPVAKLQSKYGLSKGSLYNVVNKQLAKVAEWDTEYQRRLGVLSDIARESEEQSKHLATQLQRQEKHLDVLKRQAATDKARITSLESMLSSQQETARSQQQRIAQLESALSSQKSTMFYSQHEAVKENINRYK